MIREWNSLVKSDDEVIHLGDFAMAFRSVELYTNRLMGKKTIVLGNHDFAHLYHKKSRKPGTQAPWVGKYHSNGWETVCMEMRLDLPGIGEVKLNHIPYESYIDEHGDKYKDYRPVDDGTILLCGHVHQSWKSKRSLKGTLMINVGVDVWDMKPVSVYDLVSYIKEQINAA